jgi:hypothetical protein
MGDVDVLLVTGWRLGAALDVIHGCGPGSLEDGEDVEWSGRGEIKVILSR